MGALYRKNEAKGRAWVRGFLVTAGLIYLVAFAWTGRLVGQAGTAFRAGQLDAAHATLQRAAMLRARNGRVLDALGIVDLARGREAEAREHLAAARASWIHPPAFGADRVVRSFLREGKSLAAFLYAEHRLGLDGASPELSLMAGLGALGAGRRDDAARHLESARASETTRLAAEEGLRAVEAWRRNGRVDWLVDRTGAPLAGSADGVATAASTPALGALLHAMGALKPGWRGAAWRVELSLDLELQRAASEALGEQAGGLVAIDVETGQLLAAASWPDAEAPPAALSALFEPGSILKVVTAAAALRKGADPASVFPVDCRGTTVIDARPFRDWMKHGHVESLEEAMAVSCNLAFARIAALVGPEALNAELRRYGFDESVPLPGGEEPAGTSIFLGKLRPPDAAHPAFALARRAEGLDSISITPIHAAIVAAGLARGGAPVWPGLVRRRTNLLGETIAAPAAEGKAALSEPLRADHAALLVRAMLAAVTRPDGTARRAAVEGVSAAMKTGTSGPSGRLDALMIGFAPAERPRIAWGLAARGAGKADLAAARITREFLRRIPDRLR